MRASCQFRSLAQPVSARIFATRIFAGHKGDTERLLAADFNGYVSKPFDIEELLGAVSTALGR